MPFALQEAGLEKKCLADELRLSASSAELRASAGRGSKSETKLRARKLLNAFWPCEHDSLD